MPTANPPTADAAPDQYASGRAGSSGRRLKMKALQAETGLTKQAIQFYLREGLLPEPERPKPNVAYYTDEHIQRIRTIKRFQQERSLPLSEIKVLLAKFDDYSDSLGSNSFRSDLRNFELALQTRMEGDAPGPDEPLASVIRTTGITAEELEDLAKAGVITIKSGSNSKSLDFRDYGIVQRWVSFQAMGYAGKKGFDAEFLGRYAQAMQSITETVVENFFDQFDGAPTEDAAQLAAEGVSIMNTILTRVHTQAILRSTRARIESEQTS